MDAEDHRQLRNELKELREHIDEKIEGVHSRISGVRKDFAQHETHCAEERGTQTAQMRFIKWFGMAAGGTLIAFEVNRLFGG